MVNMRIDLLWLPVAKVTDMSNSKTVHRGTRKRSMNGLLAVSRN